MKKYIVIGLGFLLFSMIHSAFHSTVWAQGPPITTDKAIMLGQKTTIIKTLTEVRYLDSGTFIKAPLMVHYLPTSNTLVAVHIPMVFGNHKSDYLEDESGLGDVQVNFKYQFFRKDKRAKTLRAVARVLQTFPTSKLDLKRDDFALDAYQTYTSFIIGYETLKYGLGGEIGYKYIPNKNGEHDHHGHYNDEFHAKLGFGLPLLKPTYPVNQLNFYFEYDFKYLTESTDGFYELLYAQGIQYAYDQVTIETAIQFPLKDKMHVGEQRRYSLFFGARYVF